jgi:hypothetical protein
MRLTLGLLLTIFVGSCTDSRHTETVDGIPQDTVYDGNVIVRENLEFRRPAIQLDNGAGDSPRFVVGDTSILRIRIPRFTEYDMHLKGVVGATIIKIDTSYNKFLVIPDNTQFSFVLNQYYPKGQVIRYTRNWNEVKATYDEQIVALDGMIEIGKLDFNAQ